MANRSPRPSGEDRVAAPAATDQKAEVRLDESLTEPQSQVAGMAPHDTTDPAEIATSVGGDKAAAAAAGHLTVNAVVPTPPGTTTHTAPAATDIPEDEQRTETYLAQRPDGKWVTVERNLDTGVSKVTGDAEAPSRSLLPRVAVSDETLAAQAKR